VICAKCWCRLSYSQRLKHDISHQSDIRTHSKADTEEKIISLAGQYGRLQSDTTGALFITQFFLDPSLPTQNNLPPQKNTKNKGMDPESPSDSDESVANHQSSKAQAKNPQRLSSDMKNN
jgi:hypothetical protein